MVKAWELLGMAMRDYYEGDFAARVWVETELLGNEWMQVGIFFRNQAQLVDLERYALSLCQGKVLDLGAGAGCHSLILAANGFEVTALDISEAAVDVMRARGLKQVICGTITTLVEMKFDTILMLMNGIGLVAELVELTNFFEQLKKFVNPGGQILLDSSDLRVVLQKQGKSLPAQQILEIAYQLKYQGLTSEKFNWLYLDQETLAKYATLAGWDAQVLYEEEEQFLVRLTSIF